MHVQSGSLKPVDKRLASGSHHASRRELPYVCGSDGVGHLDDGQRVFFGGPRLPHGAMADRTVVPRSRFTYCRLSTVMVSSPQSDQHLFPTLLETFSDLLRDRIVLDLSL